MKKTQLFIGFLHQKVGVRADGQLPLEPQGPVGGGGPPPSPYPGRATPAPLHPLGRVSAKA